MENQRPSSTNQHSLLASATCLALAAATVGCQQQLAYDASSLPPQFAAVPAINVQSLDLSRLSNSSLDSSKIYQGDTLNVSVVTGAEDRQPAPWTVTVADDGTAEVPLVGRIQLAGLNVHEAQAAVRSASVERGIYQRPSVALAVDERKKNRIIVMGAVEKPDVYELPAAGSDVLSALVAAGGLSKNADRIIAIQQPPPNATHSHPSDRYVDETEIARTSLTHNPRSRAVRTASAAGSAQHQMQHIDLVAATTGQTQNDYQLNDGAVVMVKPTPPRYVHVMGLVKQPDRFEVPPGENLRLLDALSMARGLTISVADKVYVIRNLPNLPEPVLIQVSLREAKTNDQVNLLLADGDVVSVETTPVTFVLDTVKQVLRFGVTGSTTLF